MPSINHTHTYKRIKNTKQFICADPHCTHHTFKEYLQGKASLCNECGHEFILTREKLRRAIPKCDNCANTKEAVAFRERKKILEGMGLV